MNTKLCGDPVILLVYFASGGQIFLPTGAEAERKPHSFVHEAQTGDRRIDPIEFLAGVGQPGGLLSKERVLCRIDLRQTLRQRRSR